MSKLGEKEAAQRAMREARFSKKPAGTVQRISVAEVMEQQGHPVPASKSQERRLAKTQPAALRKADAEQVQAATDEVIDKFAAGKVKLTIRIDRELMKEIKIDAVETDQTVEAWVEAAIRQELKTRRA
jgi:predicted HicB family RNase H-like nuclease